MAKFKAGESGNPGGRPKGQGDIRNLARAHTPAAIRRLVKIMNDEKASASAQVAASIALLDRGWGRPAQTINATIDRNASMIDAELDGMARDLLDKFRLGTSSEQAGISDCAVATPAVAPTRCPMV